MNRITISLALGDRQGSVASWDEAHLPVWGSISDWIAELQLRKASQSVEFDWDARILDGRGWPAIALWCAAMPKPNGGWQPAEFGNAIVLTPWTNRRYAHLSDERALPLGIVWPGFAINTVFYAGIFWLLSTAPFAVRHRLRLRRGLCAHCAYPIGASDLCTECGNPVAAPVPISSQEPQSTPA